MTDPTPRPDPAVVLTTDEVVALVVATQGDGTALAATVERIVAARTADAAARLRDLTHRLGFGDGITEPMADNDTIVRCLYDEQRDADEWREHQRWLDDCAEAGCDPTQDCPRHAPACHPAHPDADADARLAAARTVLEHPHADTCAAELLPEAGYPCSCWQADLRAALSAPAPDAGPVLCDDCGHQHTPQGCTGEPTPWDRWAGVSPSVCDCPPDPAPDAGQREAQARAEVLRELADQIDNGEVAHEDLRRSGVSVLAPLGWSDASVVEAFDYASVWVTYLRDLADRMDRP